MTLPSSTDLSTPLRLKRPSSPYPGLRPFEKTEWTIFFGRERMINDVIDQLVETQLVVVHGDSGCGKSSLIRAGVLAQLELEHSRSGLSWRTSDLRPGRTPIDRLAQGLVGLVQKPSTELLDEVHNVLNLGRGAARELAKLLRQDARTNLCILVDQFEELFSFATEHGRDEAQLFVDILVGLQEDPPPGLYAILTMRSEFLGVCARFKGLAEAVNQSQYLLPQMEPPALLRAIREPATLYDGEVSRELAERLIADAGGGQDQLPLIQHGLMQLWRRKVGAPTLQWLAEGPAQSEIAEPAASYRQERGPAWHLGREDYEPTGGLADLLSVHADRVMRAAAPEPERQKIVEHLFRALTDINAEGSAVRRPQTLGELAAVTGSDEQTLREIIDRFRADGVSFLAPYGDAAIGQDTTIDVSHEALIRCWRKIADKESGWLQREFQDGLTWQALRVQAAKFIGNNEQILSPAQTEYSDRWLQALPSASWTERYDGGWNDVQELMAASRQEAKRQQRVETARRREAEARAREEKERAERQARVARRLGYLSIALAVVTVLAAIAGVYAWRQQVAAEEQRQLAEAQKQSAQEQRQLAEAQRQLAEEQRGLARAAEQRRTDELFQSQMTRAALLAAGEHYAAAREVLEGSRQLDGLIALERRHARDFMARYVDIMGGGAQQVYQGAGAPLLAIAASPDGDLLAAVGENGTVVLFDVESGAIRQRLEGHAGNVWDVAFDPEGAWLVTVGADGQIIRWSLPTNDAPAAQLQAWQAPGTAAWSIAVSPDGRLLATGGMDGDISLWKAETGELARRLEGHGDAIAEVHGLAFSPSGQRLASASYDRTARVWDVETGNALQVFRGHSDRVNGVAYGTDEDHIATSAHQGDRRAALWDVASGRAIRVFTGHANAVYGIGYLADSIQPDAITATGEEPRPILVTGSSDRTLRVWDAETGVTLRVLEGHAAGVTGVAVGMSKETGAATQVFSASNDGTVRRWDIVPLPHQHLLDVPGQAWAAAVAPDGTRVAVGFGDGSLRLYTVPAGRLVAEVGDAHERGIIRLDFDPKGALLASASLDDSAKLWSVSGDGDLTEQQRFTGHDLDVHAVALSPDGKTLATASYDGRVGLFHVGTKDEGHFIDAHDGQVASVAFDASGIRLLSAGIQDETARLWDLSTDPPALIRAFSDFPQELLWAVSSPDDRVVAAAGRNSFVGTYSEETGQPIHQLVGHEQTVFRAIFSPDGRQLGTVSADATVRLWDLDTGAQLFALRLPADRFPPAPLWDFDFRSTPTGSWLAVPLTRGKLALYDLGPYAE